MNSFKEALKLLSKRSYFSTELRKKLLEKGCPPPEVEQALEKCKKLGYLNDQEREEHLVVSLRQKGYGPHRIAQKMREKGVKSTLWQQPLEQQIELIRALLQKRCKGDFPTDLKGRQRLYSFLARKGFDREAIVRSINIEII